MKITASKKDSCEDDDRPTTSRRYSSGISIRDSEDHDEERNEKGSKSVSTASQHREDEEEKLATTSMKSGKGRDRKRINLRTCKVQKRKSRGPARKRPKKIFRRPIYDTSASTVFSKITSISSNGITCCKYCGHRRCCRRSTKLMSSKMKRLQGIQRKYMSNAKEHRKKKYEQDSKRLQVGTPCKMFSPLFIKGNLQLQDNPYEEDKIFCQISPKMICDAIKHQTMWRDAIPTTLICDFIKSNYAVNPNTADLMKELRNQLEIARKLGLVRYVEIDMWKLNDNKNLAMPKTHVTKYWDIYGDTMKPIGRRKRN